MDIRESFIAISKILNIYNVTLEETIFELVYIVFVLSVLLIKYDYYGICIVLFRSNIVVFLYHHMYTNRLNYVT